MRQEDQYRPAGIGLSDAAPREATHPVTVGNVRIGGGAPIAVQSMLNAASDDVDANLAQIDALAEAGCEIVRMAIPARDALDVFEKVCARSPLPVVADVHFDHVIAIEAAKRGAAKLRINPGNIGSTERTVAVLEAAQEAGIPIRIGVNAGSLDSKLAEREDLSPAQKLAQSAIDYVTLFEENGFFDTVVSAKANDVPTTIETYRILSERVGHVPLHIGVTEAGTAMQGLVKSASGLGVLLYEGIGDTMRISLTDDPTLEVRAAWQLLGALGIRERLPELVSCPTCGRCKVDLITMAKEVESRLTAIDRPITVAVMGCVVNGPGEAKEADVGIASGDGCGVLFRNGRIIRKVDEADVVDELMAEIDRMTAGD